MRLLVFHHIEAQVQYQDDYRHPDGYAYRLHGGDNPTLFRTLRNAFKVAKTGRAWGRRRDPKAVPGKVVLFDCPHLLPEVAPDTEVLEHAGLADRMTMREFAERQIQLWAAIA